MGNAEEYLAKYYLGDGCLAAAVNKPLLSDLAGHLTISIQRKKHFVNSLHQLGVLFLRYGTPV